MQQSAMRQLPLASQNQLSPYEISVHTAHDLLRQDMGIICDVRQPWELQTAASLLVSIQVPLLTLRAFTGKHLEPEEKEEAPVEVILAAMPKILTRFNQSRDKGQFLLCLCRTGRRSLEAVNILQELGYYNTLSLQGGIEAWEQAGYPVT